MGKPARSLIEGGTEYVRSICTQQRRKAVDAHDAMRTCPCPSQNEESTRRANSSVRNSFELRTEDIVQSLVIGVDPGRTNIGMAVVREDGECVFSAQVHTRNKQIPKLMKARHHSGIYGRRNKEQGQAHCSCDNHWLWRRCVGAEGSVSVI